MNFEMTEDVHLVLPKAALTAVFDECDRYDHDETGGRVLGNFQEKGEKLSLEVSGIIEPGPGARRSAVSFFQDGAYQERIFRQIEQVHPAIEHLGNWHTHHMNGLTTLSGGDITTYRRIVNHHNHNTSFFYALLVVAKRKSTDPLQRYIIKHYLFRRDDERVYQIAPRMVEIVDTRLNWPSHALHTAHRATPEEAPVIDRPSVQPDRVYDRDILGEFFPGMRPFSSKKLGLYWRGSIEILNGHKQEVVVVEDTSGATPTYSVVLRDPPDPLKAAAEQLAKQEFRSARTALITTERICGRALHESGRRSRGFKWLS